LWALYVSYVHIGQDWYGYGWEIQLIETGFLAIFLCPLLDPRPFPRRPPPTIVVWLFRWLIFRIMLGAGLLKLRGDRCWRELTCVPIVACFDDAFLRRFLPAALVRRAEAAARDAVPSRTQWVAVAGVAVLVAVLSIDPVMNLVSRRQIMNTSFNRLDLVNTYG